MYPSFIKAAEAEKRSDAILAFTHAMKAEEVHAGLYKKALAAVKSGAGSGPGEGLPLPGLRQHRDGKSSRQVPDLRCFRQAVPGNYPLIFFRFFFGCFRLFLLFQPVFSALVEPEDHEDQRNQGSP